MWAQAVDEPWDLESALSIVFLLGAATPAAVRLYMEVANWMEILAVLALSDWLFVFNKPDSESSEKRRKAANFATQAFASVRLTKTSTSPSAYSDSFSVTSVYPIFPVKMSDCGIHFELPR